jgi:cystathionine beta-lyase
MYRQAMIDFDRVISRENTDSVKFDARHAVFGRGDVLPLWVADTDFPIAPAIINALTERLSHPILGYSLYPDSLYKAVIRWFLVQHNLILKKEWIVFAPGVVPSLFAFSRAFANEGEGIIIQPPVYFPFFTAVTTNQRELLLNPLKEIEGVYHIDFDDLEEKALQAKAIIFCSPHNPVGRVWTPEECKQILDIARRHNLAILSDDIHCDLVYPGNRHTFLLDLCTEADRVITTIAPNKTFNIPGMGLSALIVKNPEMRQKMQAEFDSLHISNTNPLSMKAFEAAYTQSDEWFGALMSYIESNRNFVADFFASRDLGIKANHPEATYLTWLDCRGLNKTDAELKRFFIEDCRLGLNTGVSFGEAGSGFMRINLGTQQAVLAEALQRIELALV